MKKLFGTDGVRGVANTEPMTTEIAMQIGRAIAFIVKDKTKSNSIVIGKDTRLSGYMLENALAAGEDMEEFLNVLAESFLLPDDNGNCQAFFSLIRWFLGPAAENVLSKYGYAI